MKPTCELRYVMYGTTPVLEQKWVSDYVGAEDEWRQIPTTELRYTITEKGKEMLERKA